jgi:hypothetical protein
MPSVLNLSRLSCNGSGKEEDRNNCKLKSEEKKEEER